MVSISRTRQERYESTLTSMRVIAVTIAICVVVLVFNLAGENANANAKPWKNYEATTTSTVVALSRKDALPEGMPQSKGQAPGEGGGERERESHSSRAVPPQSPPRQEGLIIATGGDGDTPKATIAYAWTLAKCSDFQSSTEGMIDAALVLKHSVHKISFRSGVSKYDYQMYVLVHPNAVHCTKVLQDAGYTIRVLDPPVNKTNIKGDYLRLKVDREWCCGSDEFIKLYSFTLFDHPVVVHVDIDFAFFQPMDELFDAMLDSGPHREAAIDKIATQYAITKDHFPPNIEAFLTRDYQQLIPGDKRSLFQAGFMVVKPNQQVFDDAIKVVLEGNFVEGWNATAGWAGLGYAGKVGAMAMQGLMAYFYDIIRPGVSVELHGCHYNWMGGDILYRNVPTFYPRMFPDLVGKCRNGKDTCEDCQKTPFSEIKSVHFTNCRKPWNCIGIKWVKGQDKKAQGIDERNTKYDKCMEIVTHWHELRKDMEDKVVARTGNDTLANMWRGGDFKKDVFLGHCRENGQSGYIPLSHGVPPSLFAQIYT